MKKGKTKAISFIKDPHVVFTDTDNRTEYAPYRLMVEVDDGEDSVIIICSVTEIDIDGSLSADEIWTLNYKECINPTPEVIHASIKAWSAPNNNFTHESTRDTALWVLSQFRRAKMIDEKTFKEILAQYE